MQRVLTETEKREVVELGYRGHCGRATSFDIKRAQELFTKDPLGYSVVHGVGRARADAEVNPLGGCA